MVKNSGVGWRAWAQWVAPSWRVLLLVAMAWSWRGLMLLARHAAVATPPQQRDAAWGFLQDAALVMGLVWLIRAGQRAADGSRWGALALVVPAWALLALSPLVRAVDLAHCYLAGSHLSAEAFSYVGAGFEDVLATPRAIGLAVATVVALLATIALVRRESEAILELELRDLEAMILAVLLAGVALTAGLWRSVERPPHEFSLRLVPEANLVRQAALYWDQQRATADAAPVDAARWVRWKQLGWVPQQARSDAAYPLVRPRAQEPELALPRLAGSPDKPDIILILLESTSTLFVHELSGQYQGLMPELSALARDMTRVDNYYNTASPTIAGTIGTLCSAWTPMHPGDMTATQLASAGPPLSCLPDLLQERGYRTVYVAGHQPQQTATAAFLLGHGFDEVYTGPDLKQRLETTGASPMGLHDRDVLRFARQQVERLESRPAAQRQPFLLVVATLDTHEPGLAPEDCQLPRDATGGVAVAGAPNDRDGLRQLAAYHCSDKVLGEFARFVLAPERRERTLLTITADHAPFRTPANESVFAGHPGGWAFDQLPLLIHDPLHQLPSRVDVLSGTLDVAPTLAHLLGIGDVHTAFVGHSILGSAKDFPALIGRVGTRVAWVKVAGGSREVPYKELAEMCNKAEPLLVGAGPYPGSCEIAAYFEWLDMLWSHGRIRPSRALSDAGL